MDLQKNPNFRIKGNAIAELNMTIHERDNYSCVNCGEYVSIAEKWHHEPCGRQKEDKPEKGCLLCWTCHQKRESKYGEPIKQKCLEYLKKLYS